MKHVFPRFFSPTAATSAPSPAASSDDSRCSDGLRTHDPSSALDEDRLGSFLRHRNAGAALLKNRAKRRRIETSSARPTGRSSSVDATDDDRFASDGRRSCCSSPRLVLRLPVVVLAPCAARRGDVGAYHSSHFGANLSKRIFTWAGIQNVAVRSVERS